MSYILDALQRADAERERGHVPGLKSQIVPPASRRVAPTRRWKLVHTTAVLVALVLLIAALAWWWFARSSDVTVATPAPMPSPAVLTAPAAPPLPAAPAVAQATPPAAAVSTPTEPVQPILAPRRVEPPKPRTPAQAPTAASTPSPAAPAPQSAGLASQTTALPSPTPTVAAAAAAAPPAATPTNPVPVRSFAELSPEARAQLPQINVSGSTYSQNPALRMLIINGKVLQEGQEIAPGFKLENIGQRSAVLNHQGMRYSIGY